MAAFDSNNSRQSQISAQRNVAGRDLTDNSQIITNNYQAPIVYREDKRLKALVDEHELEISLDKDYKEFSQKLNDFLHRKVEGKLRDLNEKLRDGDRDYLVELAMDLKESVTKKITRNSHFESAQKIYTYLLAQIRITFLSEISAKIKSSNFLLYEIDDLVLDRIIEPLLINVDGCSLLIDKEELYGLLYILTGNCYIEWD